jgi:hypothetical protein
MLRPEEEKWLGDVMKEMPNGAVVVELGVWEGHSTRAIGAGAAKYEKDIAHHCVDWFKGSPGNSCYEKAKKVDIRRRFENKTKGIPHHTIVSKSAEAAKRFADASVDFIFHDADHRYEFVYADIVSWLPKMKPMSIVCGHDWFLPDVTKAVKDTLGEPTEVIGSIWVVRKNAQTPVRA